MTQDRPVGGADGGEHPNRTDPEREGDDVGALDEAPDGQTPSDTTGSDESSLPPGAG